MKRALALGSESYELGGAHIASGANLARRPHDLTE
jgi:hypothetical protein